MRSKSALDPFTFELPEPTAEDLAALERADQRPRLSPVEYLELLNAVTKDLHSSREIDGPWPESFEL